jgi:ribosomal protein S18 acetylase RimI-like enzyme
VSRHASTVTSGTGEGGRGPRSGIVGPVKLRLTVRDLDPADLADLDWSGGAEHVRALAEALQASYADEMAVLVLALPNGRLVAVGALDLRPEPGAGVLTMLSVHEHLQSLGLGTRLVAALEKRARKRGLSRVRLGVEHDNPRALALYRRLGYQEVGSRVESWPVAGGRTYVTVSAVLQRELGPT